MSELSGKSYRMSYVRCKKFESYSCSFVKLQSIIESLWKMGFQVLFFIFFYWKFMCYCQCGVKIVMENVDFKEFLFGSYFSRSFYDCMVFCLQLYCKFENFIDLEYIG